MRRWQDAHVGFLRCSSSCARIDADRANLRHRPGSARRPVALAAERSSRLSSTHLPRSTGDVRVAYDDTVSTLPCVSTPPRGVPVRSTCRNSGPTTFGDPVVPRQPLVEERVASVDEIEHAAILADDMVDEQLGFAPHRQPQVVLELREALAIPGDRLERAELQPLAPEVLGDRARLRMAQHTPHLIRDHVGIAQRPGVGRAPQARRRACWPRESTTTASRARAA